MRTKRFLLTISILLVAVVWICPVTLVAQDKTSTSSAEAEVQHRCAATQVRQDRDHHRAQPSEREQAVGPRTMRV